MGITPKFTRNDVKGVFDRFLNVIQAKQIERLQRVGEKCLVYARAAHPNDWEDQTGNLRSSVGYMVFVDGVAVHKSPFEQVSARVTRNGVKYDGGKQGENLCRKIGAEHDGVCLVMVAGMNYAVYVESKGRDVLTGAEHMAQDELPKELAQLIANIQRAAD